MAKVAAISAGDDEVGNMVADAMEKVSNDGVITIEESKTMKTELDLVEGMQFDRGYISAYMATDMEKWKLSWMIRTSLITDKKISISRRFCRCWSRLYSPVRNCWSSQKDIEGEALTTLILNKLRGTFQVVGVKAQVMVTEEKKCSKISRNPDRRWSHFRRTGTGTERYTDQPAWTCKICQSEKENTVIVDGMGDKKEIENRIAQIKATIEVTTSEFDKEKTAGETCETGRRRSSDPCRCSYRNRDERKQNCAWKMLWMQQEQP